MEPEFRVPQLQVAFQDSSDEENAHVAPLEIIPDGADTRSYAAHGSTPAGARPGDTRGAPPSDYGWGRISRFFLATAKSACTAPREPFSSDPLAHARSASTTFTSSSSGSGWVCDMASSSEGSLTEAHLPPLPSAVEDDPDAEEIEIDLRETILQYQRMPADFHLNIILAALKSGNVRITGPILSAAAGLPFLIKIFLDSEYVDKEDEVVQHIIQQEIDRIVTGDPYKDDRIHADQGDYLRSLCSFPSARITKQQMILLRYSGFEFIKLMYDSPHLCSGLEEKAQWFYWVLRVFCALCMIFSWLGVVISLLFYAATIWALIFWLHTDNLGANGYWTIICFVVSYVANLVTSSRAHQDRIQSYDEELWPYPDVNLKIIPILPFYEIALLRVALLYELRKDKMRYFIIRYDLRNGMCIEELGNGLLFVFPQLIVQMFLVSREFSSGSMQSIPSCFWMLLGSACLSFFVTMCTFTRWMMFSHSCNTFGFAILAVDVGGTDQREWKRLVMPTDIITHALHFFTLYFLITVGVALLIFLIGVSTCTTEEIAFLSIFFAVGVLSAAVFAVLLFYGSFSRLSGFLSLPALIMQATFLVMLSKQHNASTCYLYSFGWTGPTIISLVTFSCVAAVFVLWLLTCLYEVITGKRIRQEFIDTHVDF